MAISQAQFTISDLNDGATGAQGNRAEIQFICQQSQPVTPTGNSPSGWSTTVPTSGFGNIWYTMGVKDKDGNLVGSWSFPAAYNPYSSNLLSGHAWTVGSGTVDIYNINGSTAENVREINDTPFGSKDIIWRAIDQDTTSGPEGGWNVSGIPIDSTQMYRVSVWAKQLSAAGSVYLGCDNTGNTNNMDGTTQINPYFISGVDLPSVGKWYLLVGFIYGANATETTNHPLGGVYDGTTGLKSSIPSYSFKTKIGASTQMHRTYQYYSTVVGTETQFWNPRFDLCDGKEPSIQDLLKTGAQGLTGSTGKGISSITNHYLATTASSGVTSATAGWTTTVQTMTTTNCFLWNYQTITYTDNSTVDTTPAMVGAYGNTGSPGKGITSITNYYLATTASTGVTTSTSGWTTTNQTPTSTNKYVWTYQKITYTDSTTTTIGPSIMGVYGDTGATTYTWVKYADDIYGGNMTDTPTGKRYVGMAFNKTTATESTLASDYSWSPLYENVVVGGRNFLLNSKYDWTQVGALTTTYYIPTDSAMSLAPTLVSAFNQNGNLTLSLSYKTTNVVWGTTNPWAGLELSVNFSDGTTSWWDCGGTKSFQTNTSDFVRQVNHYTLPTGKTVTSIGLTTLVRDLTGTVEMKDFKIEIGNINTDWSPAPEDIQSQLDYKAAQADMDSLSSIVSSVSATVNAKAGMGEFQALQDAFNARVAQDIADKDALSASLATLDGRTTLVETIANNSKIVTDFVNTVITESDEGIYIANSASSTGILIKSDRISFMSNNVEVAFISNQTLEINNGIFVDSAVIANFKFELIPGTTILAVQWVGG